MHRLGHVAGMDCRQRGIDHDIAVFIVDGIERIVGLLQMGVDDLEYLGGIRSGPRRVGSNAHLADLD